MKNTYQDSTVYQFLENFNDVYENCNIHSFDYTEKIFLEDFSENLLDIIEIDQDYKIPSASIAQVYKGTIKSTGEKIAIKVRHPNLEGEILYPYLFYKLYNYLTHNISYFSNYMIPFDLSSFFNNFTKQIDMSDEANNLNYFYKEYKNHPLVNIPKPIFWSKNILVMEYIEGEDFENIDITKYKQYKFVLLVNLFVRNNLINLEKIHADLHSSNWKIIRDKDTEKIVVYDFGFCIDIPNNSRENIRNLNKSIETNDHILFANCIYKYLKTKCSKETYLRDAYLFLENNKNRINIQNYIEFCINKKYVFTSDILDLTLSSFLVNNYFKRYISCKNIEDDFEKEDIDNIKKLENTNNHLMTLSSICDINNCYIDLNEFFKDFIDENRKIIIKIKQNGINNIVNNKKSYNYNQLIDI